MNKLNLEILKGFSITTIHGLVLIDKYNKYELEDTLLIKVSDDFFYQIIIQDNELEIYNINNINNIKILGEYDLKNTNITTSILANFSNIIISLIRNFIITKSNFLFGSKFFEENEKFVFGFCYGFDEIKFIGDEAIFDKMILSYTDNNSVSSYEI